jgi:ABC-type nitrate/sulfonate/bicarbonate transport system permease component
MRRLFDPIKLAALGFALLLLVAWQLLADAHLISPIFFPSPLRALTVLQQRLVDGSLWLPLAATSLRMTVGWLLASVIGIGLGAAIGSSRLARNLLDPTLEFIRPLPASAVIPVAILFLGLSNKMSVAVIAFGAIWPVLLASVHGFSSVPLELANVSQVLGFGRWDFLRKIAFPSALPDIVAGLRVSLAIALILTVVTEMQSSLPGLGWDIFSAQRFYRSADLYAGLIMLALLGFAANHLILLLEWRVLRWRDLRT